MTLRTLIFWPHLIAGVIAGAIILLMSVTGVILTYERQLIAWSDSGFKSKPAPGAARLSPEALLTKIRQDHPDLEVSAVTFVADQAEVVEEIDGCAQVRDGILITLGEPVGAGDRRTVDVNGFVACLGATWLTYVVERSGGGWVITGTDGSIAIS